jgi:hypothetical protein
MGVPNGVTQFSPEDGDSMFLRNVGIYLQARMALQPRRPTSTNLIKVRRVVLEMKHADRTDLGSSIHSFYGVFSNERI